MFTYRVYSDEGLKLSFIIFQDTVIALQALSEYSSRTAGGELDLQITVTATRNKDVRKIIKVLPENALVRQQFDVSLLPLCIRWK